LSILLNKIKTRRREEHGEEAKRKRDKGCKSRGEENEKGWVQNNECESKIRRP
jgi:hypothetical protein